MTDLKKNKRYYCDLHTHSIQSDGKDSRENLIRKAIQENPDAMMILAISDHNKVFEDIEELQEAFKNQIILVPGCEVSCTYITSSGKKKEIHINALNYEMSCLDFLEMLKKNKHDKRAYVEAILQKLEDIGIHVVDSYEELVEFVAPSDHVGRMALARMMVKKGIAATIEEPFDKYFGSYGDRLCYVDNPFEFVSLEEAMKAMKKANATTSLCHPLYYHLEEAELRRLISQFKALGGDALEAEYGAYSVETRAAVKELAAEFGLKISAGSDYHGNVKEHLHHEFPGEIYEELVKKTI